MNHKKIKMVIAGLGGRGHDIYSNYGWNILMIWKSSQSLTRETDR